MPALEALGPLSGAHAVEPGLNTAHYARDGGNIEDLARALVGQAHLSGLVDHHSLIGVQLVVALHHLRHRDWLNTVIARLVFLSFIGGLLRTLAVDVQRRASCGLSAFAVCLRNH
eukprot:CAMPEP_0185573844 /NCGR_PEP_ID=MMETSP0434-20130131/5441_1 /TAXON_ID=626734 ORGANISM="Favella taraikaensis, Strain Fe Narragansett Bay" /NCGR_SAMPLE_ID=MMETSP0434 /ASSEMBLY_ACC=CAM_ASM_000379 /LENGTH=114 /DNA_ID=CAMNT_0028190199 /DNA_START=522 /DNA_END=863 /DNA_ORIENTATION=+